MTLSLHLNRPATLQATAPRAIDTRAQGAPLKEADAVEIWIARWLRLPLKVLVAHYGCDSRRLYEVWWGDRFPASRAKAEAEFRRRHPTLSDRTSYGYRRIPRASPGDAQMALFD